MWRGCHEVLYEELRSTEESESELFELGLEREVHQRNPEKRSLS